MVRIDFFRALWKFYHESHSLCFAHLWYLRYILNLQTVQSEDVDVFLTFAYLNVQVFVCVCVCEMLCAWDSVCVLVYVLYVQEVVTHFYSNLLYKMGHYFLDRRYLILFCLAFFFFFLSISLSSFFPSFYFSFFNLNEFYFKGSSYNNLCFQGFQLSSSIKVYKEKVPFFARTSIYTLYSFEVSN